jgi:cardiolipin-specific phospholipase
MFWSSAKAQLASKLESMQNAEATLVKFALLFGGRDASSYDMELFDTAIPKSSVPLKPCPLTSCEGNDEELVIHGVKLSSKEASSSRINTPLVLQHGYMNGALYFFRNLVGLSNYFENVYAIDMLGWGLSSRPLFRLRDDSVETTEEFFVESLEAWREKNGIDKMILAGHSMGGYLSVAYSEKYPERVEKLILLSPVGVPEQSQQLDAIRKNATFSRRMFLSLYTTMFENGTTPCSVFRALPKKKARQYIESYVKNRLPAITNPEEQSAVADYLFYNAILPGSAEFCVNRILNPTVLAKKPLVNRIPNLKIPSVAFLYGEFHILTELSLRGLQCSNLTQTLLTGSSDWMECSGGLDTQSACEAQHRRGHASPSVDVYSVRHAGHLLMLDNWQEFNAGVVISAGGANALASDDLPQPIKLSPTRPMKERLRPNAVVVAQNESMPQQTPVQA